MKEIEFRKKGWKPAKWAEKRAWPEICCDDCQYYPCSTILGDCPAYIPKSASIRSTNITHDDVRDPTTEKTEVNP